MENKQHAERIMKELNTLQLFLFELHRNLSSIGEAFEEGASKDEIKKLIKGFHTGLAHTDRRLVLLEELMTNE